MLAGCAANDPFTRLDANRDGAGSPAEFDSYMKQDVFNRVDADRNSEVTLTEWQVVNPNVNKARFNKADKNRDGSITRPEADAAFDREGCLPKLFREIDADGDGALSRAEATAFRNKVRQQPGATPAEKISKASQS